MRNFSRAVSGAAAGRPTQKETCKPAARVGVKPSKCSFATTLRSLAPSKWTTDDVKKQTTFLTFLKAKPVQIGCQKQHVEQCRLGCPLQYQDAHRSLCPCYSKLSQCLVAIGCSMRQKVTIFAFCTRKGYCKDGYCAFRAGDLTPRIDTRPEIFEITSVATPGSPCVDNCCSGQSGGCAQNASLQSVRAASRVYRKEEVTLPPRQGDPRVGVNQNYDRMAYSIPLANLP